MNNSINTEQNLSDKYKAALNRENELFRRLGQTANESEQASLRAELRTAENDTVRAKCAVFSSDTNFIQAVNQTGISIFLD